MKHNGGPVGAGIVGTEVDLKGNNEIPTHIEALARHRRPHLIKPTACGGQGDHVVRNPRVPARPQALVRR